MKKYFIIPILGLALALSSCGTNTDDNQENVNNTTEQSEKKEDTEIDTKDVTNDSNDKAKSNEDAEEFPVMEDNDGNKLTFADYKGKKTYAKFWASWCPICVQTLGEFDEMFTDHDGYNVVSVVAPDQFGEKSKEDFLKWFEALGYENIENFYDMTGDFTNDFSIRSTPTNIFIDSEGQVTKVVPGAMDKDTVEEILGQIN